MGLFDKFKKKEDVQKTKKYDTGRFCKNLPRNQTNCF